MVCQNIFSWRSHRGQTKRSLVTSAGTNGASGTHTRVRDVQAFRRVPVVVANLRGALGGS